MRVSRLDPVAIWLANRYNVASEQEAPGIAKLLREYLYCADYCFELPYNEASARDIKARADRFRGRTNVH